MRYKFIDKALIIDNIFVISDIHVGYEEALNKQGVLIPRHQFEETMQDLKKIFVELENKKEKIKEIVILGDLKHEFGEISDSEWRDTFKFLEYLFEKCKKIICIKGTHDTILAPILRKFPSVKFLDYYINDNVAFLHGDKDQGFCNPIRDKQIKLIVRGHLHPAITISSGAKKETYKCFLVGKEKGKEIIILPSFLPIIEGMDVSGMGEFFNFKVFVVGDKVYEFGKVKNIE